MAFGLTTTTNSYTVDTGAQLVFSVARTTASSAAVGDLTSFKLSGTELEAPHSATSRYSHYESGLSSSTVVSATVDPAGNWIMIACDDTGATGVGVIQYYIAHKGENNIYMATYAPGPTEPSPGEMRYIAYLNWSIFTNHPAPSDTSGGQTVIESQDVFQDPTTGFTHSKYYGEIRMIDDIDHGATGSLPGTTGTTVGAYMFMGNRETGSGGPFYKDIDFQSEGNAVEIYNYMVSGHSQTENWRPGLQGPYALQFTNGSAPVAPNYSFIDGLGLAGWVSPSARGSVSGNASGVPSGHAVTVALSNAAAQYWTTPDASGNYTISNAKPGTYTETLYQDELAVGTQTVTITAGATTGQNITDTYYTPPEIWRIGTFDGTPAGFLNANLMPNMHPSDPRMSPWVNSTFTVGTSPDDSWLYAQFKDPTLDNTNRISFNLTSAQAAIAMTLRIAISWAGAGGRPIISVNGGNYSSAPPATTQPTARGVTLGNWRGNNFTFTYNISTSALHSGTNTIDIEVASGSSSTSPYLQPSFIYDAIDLVTTSSLTNAPHVASITVTPANPTVLTGAQQLFSAAALDQFGQPIPANFVWSSTVGGVDGTGLFTAPGSATAGTVTATSGSVSGNDGVTVIPPLAVTSGEFDYQTAQSLVLNFNRAVDPTMLAGAISLTNQTTQATVSPASIHLAYSNITGTFTFTSILPDGNYRAMIPASATLNSAGEHLTTDYTFNFFIQTGDADHNGIVNAADFTLLAQNFGKTNATWGQGDFNYDGVVNAIDFSLLATTFGMVLSASPLSSDVAAAPVQVFGTKLVASSPVASFAPASNLFGGSEIKSHPQDDLDDV